MKPSYYFKLVSLILIAFKFFYVIFKIWLGKKYCTCSKNRIKKNSQGYGIDYVWLKMEHVTVNFYKNIQTKITTEFLCSLNIYVRKLFGHITCKQKNIKYGTSCSCCQLPLTLLHISFKKLEQFHRVPSISINHMAIKYR